MHVVMAAPAAAQGAPDEVGEWSQLYNWPLVAVHSVVQPTGEVLVWDAWENPTPSARLWNPATLAFTPVPYEETAMFCAAMSFLPDGRNLITGGYGGVGNVGVIDTNIFDWSDSSWTRVADMAYPRWYPTTTTLNDGRVITFGGEITLGEFADIPEVYDPDTNVWTEIPSAAKPFGGFYPQTYLTPDGRIFLINATDGISSFLDLNTGLWSDIGPAPVRGTSVMYRPGQVMSTGGSGDSGMDDSTAVIDLNAPTPAWRETAPMAFQRFQHDVVMLPDGQVMVIGGSDVASLISTTGVLQAEMWNPDTEVWTELTPMQNLRMYHSTSVLLPDGRILVAGGGRLPPAVDYFTAEIYSPPYLFKGPRPTITNAPTFTAYNTPIAIDTPDAGDIASVSMIRLSAVTHSFNMEQRFIPLNFTASGGTVTATSPVDANTAPPGYYMMFILNSDGVPSVAQIIRVGEDLGQTNLLPIADAGLDQTVADNDGNGVETVTLDGSGSSDPDGNIVSYRWLEGGVEIGTGASASVDFATGDHDVTLIVSDDAGAQDTDTVTIRVTNSTSVIAQITNGSDDVNEDGPDYSEFAGGVWVGTRGDPTNSYTGLRFQSINIPQGATIISAMLEMNAVDNQWLTIEMDIAGDAADSSAPFSPTDAPSDRTLTTQSVSHVSNTGWTAGTWYELEDVTTVVQEIINRPGWQQSNHLSLILQGAGGPWGAKFANSYEIDPLLAPRLIIEYDPSTAGPQLPVADAGPDQTVVDVNSSGSEIVTLDGSGSSDTDGTIVSYSWEEGGVEVTTGVSPVLDLAVGVHTFTLTVTDNDGGQDTDTVVITVNDASVPNDPPTADAGPDQNVIDSDDNGTEAVTLDGSGSADTDGTIVSYSWQEGGTQIATGVNPSVDLAVGTHTITLIVTDNNGDTDSDTVSVTVSRPGNNATLTLQVQSSDDDVNEEGPDFSTLIPSVWVGTRGNVNASYTGLRFTGVNLPQGTTIVSAALELHAADNQWLTIEMDIAGDAATNSAPFSPADAPSDRTLTTAIVSHSSNTGWTVNTWYELADITSILQEIVNQPGWVSGNSLSLIIQGTGGPWGAKFATSYDGSPALAPRLIVTYDSSTAGPVPPTAEAGTNQAVTDADGDGTESITLDGSGSTDSDGTIVSYSWDEGGTEIATGVNPTIDLAEGVHTITLTVTDDDDLTDSDTLTVTVFPNTTPTAAAGPDQTLADVDGDGTESVTLDGSGSADSDGTIISYSWDDGGTEIATGVNPTLDLAVGVHTIVLTVTDNGGGEATDSVTITIDPNTAPTADAGPDQTIVDTDDNGTESITLNASGSADSDGTIVSYSWDEGGIEIATGVNPTLDLAVGVHTIILTVTDDGGAQATDTVLVTINSAATNIAPTADAGGNQTVADLDSSGSELITLDGSGSVDTDGTIVSYSWDEGGTEIATGVSPSVDLAVGTHNLTLTVTDDDGDTGTDTVVITVNDNNAPTAAAGPDQTVTDSDGSGVESVTLDGSGSSDSDGTIVSYSWTEGGVEFATGVSPSASLAPGVHTITLTVTDDGGATDTDTVVITVNPNAAPTAVAGPDQTVVDSDDDGTESITLDGSGSSDGDGAIVSYSWQEGGTEIATGVGPMLDLAVGTHNLTLVVTDNGGAQATDTVTITINAAPAGPETLTLQVNSSSDDVNEDGSDFSTLLPSVWVGTRASATNSYAGLRFNNVTLLPGTTIVSARLELHSASAQWLTIGMDIAGDATANSATFSISDLPSDRTLTTAMVAHNSNTGWSDATWYELADVASVVQEIIDQAGWQAGNSLSLVLHGTGGSWGSKFATSYDGSPAFAPRLVIEYDASTAGPQAPVADAGPDQVAQDSDGSGIESITLDGAGSSDSDGTIVSYSWRNGATEIATGVNPSVDLAVGSYSLTLVVTDNDGSTDSDVVSVNIFPNAPPTAAAGPDQAVQDTDGNGTESITLDGSGSSDSDGTIASYAWEEGGIEIATGVNPSVDLALGSHTITLIVTDNGGGQGTDTVDVTVSAEEPPNLPPTAVAGPDQTVTDSDGSGAESVTLDGSGSTDSDGTIVSYAWEEGGTQIATGVNPSVSLAVGTHALMLVVTDDDGDQSSDAVTITVEAPAGGNTITVQVPSATDDVNEDGSDYTEFSAEVWVGNKASLTASYTGLRFTGVNIPPGATIVSAELELHAATSQWNPIALDIAGDAAANSAPFSIGDLPSQRTLTTATISHSSNTNWVAGTWYTLEDVAAIVQEIVDQPGWASGNSLALVMQGTGSAWGSKHATTYEVSASEAARLVITYDTGSGGAALLSAPIAPDPTEETSTPDPTATPAPEVTEEPTLEPPISTPEVTPDPTETLTPAPPPNSPPTAEAGADQTLEDSDGDGTQAVTLDGSGSTDSDGTIVSYSWQDGGTEITTSANPTVDLAVGTHNLTLVVTDDGGDQGADTVTITVTAPPEETNLLQFVL